jgi:hypothetical protein
MLKTIFAKPSCTHSDTRTTKSVVDLKGERVVIELDYCQDCKAQTDKRTKPYGG